MKISKIKKKINNYNFLCVGASHIDNILKLENKYKLYRTNPVDSLKQPGGVAYNIANNIKLFTNNINFFSLPNKQIRENIFQKKIKYHSISNIQNDSFYTAIINNQGKLLIGLASNKTYEKLNVINFLKINNFIRKNTYFILDLCFNEPLINKIIKYYYKRKLKIMIAGTSIYKINRIKKSLKKISALCLNEDEALILSNKKTIKSSIYYMLKINPNIALVITRGSKPVFMVLNNILYKGSVPKIEVKNENGAGDAFSAMFFLCVAANFSPNSTLSMSIALGCLNVMDYKFTNKQKFNDNFQSIIKKIIIKKYDKK